jgi:hypothetical protein
MEEIMESIMVNYEHDGKVAYFDGHRFVRDEKQDTTYHPIK